MDKVMTIRQFVEEEYMNEAAIRSGVLSSETVGQQRFHDIEKVIADPELATRCIRALSLHARDLRAEATVLENTIAYIKAQVS